MPFRLAAFAVFLAPAIHLLLAELQPFVPPGARLRTWLLAFALLAAAAFLYYHKCPELIRRAYPFSRFVAQKGSKQQLNECLIQAFCKDRITVDSELADWLHEFGYRIGLGTSLHITAEQANPAYVEHRLRLLDISEGQVEVAYGLVVTLLDSNHRLTRGSIAILSGAGLFLAGFIETSNIVLLASGFDTVRTVGRWLGL
jgi:hypothetical protein